MEAPYELKVTQVTDGTNYKGHLKLGKATLLFEMVFTVAIPRLDQDGPASPDFEALKNLFQITIRRQDETILLTDDEYAFFLRALLEEVVNFYGLSQTRDANDSIVGTAMRHSMPGFSAEISTISSGTYNLPDEIGDMLNGPKFECQLAA